MPSLRLPTFSAALPKDESYVLSCDEGETITLIGSGSIMRYLTGADQTDDAFAVAQTRARDDEAVPAQYVISRLLQKRQTSSHSNTLNTASTRSPTTHSSSR